MKPEIQLIQLYLWVCTTYDNHPTLKYQRWSNNPTEARFSDQELLTVYLFAMLQGHFKQPALHRYVQGQGVRGFPFTELSGMQSPEPRLKRLAPPLLGQTLVSPWRRTLEALATPLRRLR